MNIESEKKSLRELLAVPGQNPAVVLDAIREGVDVNESNENGFTPLMFAVLLNDEREIVRALIEAGADVNAETRDGMTALMWAVSAETHGPDDGDPSGFLDRERRRVEVASLLVASGADVNATCFSARRKKWTPLLFATLEPDRNEAVIFLMLEAGAEPNARTEDGISALFHAAAFGHSSGVVRALIRAGADVDAKGRQEGREGWTPLICALTGPCKSLPVVEELLRCGASVDIAVSGGQTPLHFAVSIGDTPGYVHALLEAGANVHALDSGGNSALDCAMALNFPNVVGRLIKAGAV